MGNRTDQNKGPLAGVTVIDLTTTFMGPYCTLTLAQMGADVIKIEAPGGDVVRRIGTGRNEAMGPIFLNANHSKRSVELDLKKSAGRQVLLELLGQADVFVTNLRQTALKKLSLAYTDFSSNLSRVIYCSLVGFGSSGPYSGRAAYDDIIQAISGVSVVQGGEQSPEYVRSPFADKTVGLVAAGAVNAALYSREVTGFGQFVEVPMFESLVGFNMLEQQGGHVFDPPNGPVGYSRMTTPSRRPYRTADGFLGVVVYTDKQWASFFRLIDRPDMINDPRFSNITARTENIDELYEMLEQELAHRTSAAWQAEFDRLGISCAPVKGIEGLFEDAHLQDVNYFQDFDHPSEGRLKVPHYPVLFSESKSAAIKHAPQLGEHGVEVLSEFGIDSDRIQTLLDDGALGSGFEGGGQSN